MTACYFVGTFRLDAERCLLLRAEQPLGLGQRAVAVLRALVERRGELVTKDELIEAAWPGLVVEESNLSVQISALRRVFAEEQGGDRWIETMPRRGYRFVGPLTTDAPSLPDDAAEAPATVLVIDDHALVRTALHGVLLRLLPRSHILEASNGADARQCLEKYPDVSLILLDLSLPDAHGLDLLVELRRANPTRSVVILSADQDRHAVEKALQLGSSGYIPKSASLEVMVGAFRLILAGGVYIPPQILGSSDASIQGGSPA